MGLLRSEITPPQVDLGCLVASVIIGLAIAFVMLLEGSLRGFALLTMIALVNSFNAWRAWRYLPNPVPAKTRFRVRELLLLMTILAVILGIMYAVK